MCYLWFQKDTNYKNDNHNFCEHNRYVDMFLLKRTKLHRNSKDNNIRPRSCQIKCEGEQNKWDTEVAIVVKHLLQPTKVLAVQAAKGAPTTKRNSSAPSLAVHLNKGTSSKTNYLNLPTVQDFSRKLKNLHMIKCTTQLLILYNWILLLLRIENSKGTDS